jgi:hypothetical protein
MRVANWLEPEPPGPWPTQFSALVATQHCEGSAAGSFATGATFLGAGVVLDTAFSVLTMEQALRSR